MLLAIDIGNTNITIGAFDFPDIRHSWRINCDRSRTADEYALLLKSLVQSAGVCPEDISAAIVGSVVPPLTDAVAGSVRLALRVEPQIARSNAIPGTRPLVDNPPEVGIDRLANCVAAHERHGSPAIIVDFGTTTNFDVTSTDGHYVGGVIAPGISMSIESLFQGASQLPRIQFRRPEKIVGANTVACMETGVYWGYVYLVRTMVDAISDELGNDPRVIATGGLAPALANEIESIDDIDPALTLHGLAIIHQRLQEQSR